MKAALTRLAACAMLALTLAACSTTSGLIDKVGQAYQTVADSSVPPTAIASAISVFDAFKITATNYTRLPKCNGSNAPVCRDPAIRVTLKNAVVSGTVARNNLKAFLRQHPSSLGPQGIYDALVTATNTIGDATAAYRAAGGK